MKDYIQQLIELFGHNNYSADTHKKVQQWLADEEHVDEKSEALRELWKQAGEQKGLMACNNQYNECGRIWECSLSLHVEITSCLYGELQLFYC